MALFTEFAPPDRAAPARLQADIARFDAGWNVAPLLDLVPDLVMILNGERQVVYANRATLQFVQAETPSEVFGLRPGELFGCRHAAEAESGCGTTRFCQYCGAVRTVLQSQAGHSAVEECRMLIVDENGERALDLRVWANPMRIGDSAYTFYALVDIADEKRRVFLENIFLHDVMNTATALQGFSSLMLQGTDDRETQECIRRVATLSEWLIDEIEAHRQLVAAESGELVASFESLSSAKLVSEVFGAYNSRDLLNGRLLRVADGSADVRFRTDPSLLRRVLGNLVKNAVEGSAPGETVTLGCAARGDRISFTVHNPTYIPENIRLQMFNRSFSTKGAGRGLGTYSVKFISERYLEGNVSFVSTEEEGTTFVAEYPLRASGG